MSGSDGRRGIHKKSYSVNIAKWMDGSTGITNHAGSLSMEEIGGRCCTGGRSSLLVGPRKKKKAKIT